MFCDKNYNKQLIEEEIEEEELRVAYFTIDPIRVHRYDQKARQSLSSVTSKNKKHTP
jgi:hypothetical protein